ncbi:MAG: hypothetical protein R3D80_08500 [Paracoccaceae bacterium]
MIVSLTASAKRGGLTAGVAGFERQDRDHRTRDCRFEPARPDPPSQGRSQQERGHDEQRQRDPRGTDARLRGRRDQPVAFPRDRLDDGLVGIVQHPADLGDALDQPFLGPVPVLPDAVEQAVTPDEVVGAFGKGAQHFHRLMPQLDRHAVPVRETPALRVEDQGPEAEFSRFHVFSFA